MAIQIRPLQPSDDRKAFSCGQADLDTFFQRYAGQNQFRYNIGVTYVAVEEATICGYVTIATGSIEAESLLPSSKLPRTYPLPILRLGRLAVDQRYQGQGVGKFLLQHVLLLALQQRDTVGCVGIVVDAKPEAIAFYQRYGFQHLGEVVEGQMSGYPAPTPMFLSIKSIPSI